MTLRKSDREDLSEDPLLADVPTRDGWKVLPPTVLHSRIGDGAMGAVYRAKHLELKIDVAVKCLKPSVEARYSASVPRFQREARLAAKLSHQNLVRIYGLRREHGLSYLVLELVEGETAEERVRRKGPLPEAQAAKILLAVARGLAVAHRHPEVIIHRDIKPANILISKQGTVKLADLGLAKALEREDGTALITQGVLGTPLYMSPEQWDENAQLAPSTDVWSMGVTLYFLLTGVHAMAGCSIHQLRNGGANDGMPDVRSHRDDLSEGLVAILRRCTALDPESRYGDALQLAQDLQLHLRSLASAGEADTARRWHTSRPARIAGTCVVLFALALAWHWAAGGRDSSEPGARRAWTAALSGGAPTPFFVDEEANSKAPLGWSVVDGALGAEGWARKVRESKSGIAFALVPAGEFMMGSPDEEEGRGGDEFEHRVELTRPFYMSETEVTVRELLSGAGREVPDRRDLDMPATGIDWHAALDFCDAIRCSLPTEAQWEYAARAGTSGRFWWGDEPAVALGKVNAFSLLEDEQANSVRSAFSEGVPHGILPAGSQDANAFGLRDMQGNVWEWCFDEYIEDYEGLSPMDPFAPPFREGWRVLRGGAWNSTPPECRAASRLAFSSKSFPANADYRDKIGFRVVLTLR